MPFLGIGLHIFVAIFFAIHVVRTGQNMYWLMILFMFPLLGSVVYGFAVYLPSTRLEHGAKKVVNATAKILDPGRELRDARAAFDYTPTAQNQMRLAAALLQSGQAEEAATNYEACLKGPFASDFEIRLGAARAFIECRRFDQAISHLQFIRNTDANYRAEQTAVLMARALGGAGRKEEAKQEFETAVQKFGNFEVRAEYAIWAAGAGDLHTATALKGELDLTIKRWNSRTRSLNAEILQRLSNAYASIQNS
jgi:hypothetical protein